MALGPVEVLVFSFPGNQFNGEIIPELERLTAAGIITVIDGVFVTKDDAGDVAFVEFEQLVGKGPDGRQLQGSQGRVHQHPGCGGCGQDRRLDPRRPW